MIIKFTKRLLALVLVVTVVFLSRITVATADNFINSNQVILAENSQETIQAKIILEDILTPQERQKIQAIRQQRNREIAKILNLSQRQELQHQLHSGNNLDQSLSAINLDSEQKELIQAIQELSNLKIKSIVPRHAILQGKKLS
jgi:Spy/CpxP family protein refolding chaperone